VKCVDVTFDMKDEYYGGSTSTARPGDLLWHYKAPDGLQGHVLSDRTEQRDYGWVCLTIRLCECGYADLEDHHLVLLAVQDLAPDGDEGKVATREAG